MLIFPGILSMCFSMPFLTTPSALMTTGTVIVFNPHIIIIIITVIIIMTVKTSVCYIQLSSITRRCQQRNPWAIKAKLITKKRPSTTLKKMSFSSMKALLATETSRVRTLRL